MNSIRIMWWNSAKPMPITEEGPTPELPSLQGDSGASASENRSVLAKYPFTKCASITQYCPSFTLCCGWGEAREPSRATEAQRGPEEVLRTQAKVRTMAGAIKRGKGPALPKPGWAGGRRPPQPKGFQLWGKQGLATESLWKGLWPWLMRL